MVSVAIGEEAGVKIEMKTAGFEFDFGEDEAVLLFPGQMG